MKLTKVALAIAGALAVVAGSAHAGQIDSSSVTLAIEVIKDNTQIVRAPSKSYGFAGDIDARTNEQRLQLQYTLSKGTWAAATGNTITAVDSLKDVSTAGLLSVTYSDAGNAPQVALPTGTTVNAFVTTDRKTLVLNVTIPATNAAENFLRSPVFSLNTQGDVATNNVGINGLFDVAGATACKAPDSSADINFKHFTNHTGNTTLQLVASPDSEHLRSGSTNDARLLNFTQNLAFQFTPAASASRTDAQFLNQRLAGQNWAAPIVAPTAPAAPVTRHYIGKVNLQLVGNGKDLDYVSTYGDAVPALPGGAAFVAGDFDYLNDAGDLAAGQIEVNTFSVALTLSAAWPTGTVIQVADALGAVIAPADVTVTPNAARTVYTVTAITAAGAAAIANGAFLFADFPGTALIPQTPSVATVATITKDATAGTPDRREQDNTCSGTLTGIGGGIKIDVRNYASFAKFGTTGPSSSIRIINNSEGQAADVYAQIIYANGKYGPWGKIADLAPRAVTNLSSQAIEAQLTNAPAATNPFGAGTVYEAEAGAAVIGSGAAGIGDRLRIVSNTGSTLRVQSYMALGNLVMDTSSGQGVDFENETNNRTPSTAVDAQPVSQDAINGLGR